MGLDFDALEFCKNLKLKQTPPFSCPVSKCDRSYKTVIGLQYHLLKYDHDNPQPLTPVFTPNRKKARSRGAKHTTPKGPKSAGSDDGMLCGINGAGGVATTGKHINVNPESLVTYNEEEQTVQFNLDGKSVRLGVDEQLPFIDDTEYADLVTRGCILNADSPSIEDNASWARVKVPEARYMEIADYNVPDAPVRPLAYYRFIEKSVEELDGEIEYDVDEEDTAWLEWMNDQREKCGLNVVSIDTMELLMDRLEKESYFQAAANGTTTGVEVDDDAVCCICMDGECQNTNVILFCDMCNLAVHQDCYGVPYIPEGQWLCRRCLQSPSTPVSCVLCPNTGGAFKQTDRGQWAHVVCALWIPEVRFANTVFLEPIDSIETIPAARWRLTCYVCKEKGLGACIQCQRNSCYAAFHVTCAQQAGLYMTMDTVKDGHNDSSVHVQKYAYCHAHTPIDAKLKTNQKEVEDTRHKMKEARKALAKKRSSAPVVLIPTIPPDRIQEIAGMVHMQKKSQFLDRLIAYWTLKRQYRNGVPLLRRLQSQGNHHGVIHRNGIEGSPDANELYRQLKYWQCLRQDLERARLLCELVRKREKLKAAYVKICEQATMLELNPIDSAMTKLLDALEARDTSEIFREPVNTEEVPDYLDIVKHPMDLGTMREKLKKGEYMTLEQLEVDFDLMIQNCLAYNNKDTVFYRAGIRMRDQAAPLFQQVREDLKREGLLDSSQCEQRDHVEDEVEEELRELLSSSPSEEIVQKLLILADKSQVLKNPSYRTKKIKQIRVEITRMRKAIQKARAEARNTLNSRNNIPQTEDEDDDMETHPDENEISIAKKLKEQQQQQQKFIQQQYQTPRRSRRPTVSAAQSSYVDDDDEEEEDDDDDTMGEESKATTITAQTPPCSPIKSLNNSASPVGVNRRTAVLFTRKAQAALKRPSEASTPVKEEHTQSSASMAVSLNNSLNNATAAVAAAAAASLSAKAILLNSNKLGVASHHQQQQQHQQHQQQQQHHQHQQQQQQHHHHHHSQHLSSSSGLLGLNSSSAVKSPKRMGRHKRLAETLRHSGAAMSSKKPPPSNTLNMTGSIITPAGETLSFTERIPDSFRVYRANNERDVSESDEDDLSDISGSPCSSCSGFSISGTDSEYDSSDIDDDFAGTKPRVPNVVENEDDDDDDDEDDDDDDDEDADADADADAASRNDNEMRGNGNVAPMSCSGRSESSNEEDEEMSAAASASAAAANNNKNSRKLMTSRKNCTPTPTADISENMKGAGGGGGGGGKAARSKQKRKGKSNKGMMMMSSKRNTTNTPISIPEPAADESEGGGYPAINKIPPGRVKNKMQTRASTPTAASAVQSVNNSRRKGSRNSNHKNSKQSYSHRKTVSNACSPNATPTPTPTPPLTLHNEDNTTEDAMSNNVDETNSELSKPPLEPLQLVWAKCRGYPWYPALILDPKTPTGFVYNGVPLPAPPQDVLALRKNCIEDVVFLVLFFDAKRTWQWLPANKLEILGIDKELDQAKLVESRKPTERKAVKKAYQDALHYQSQVSDLEGQGPDPIM